ncbi:hypothetical protein A5742_30350 [Mycolicibacterium fortuitum]|uniref:TIR domain-containing protein n=1 Tax=Mycolicibacterium fortuitum TaxID=1766 RepID=A0ABD6QJM6_MYCFO|nr:toll/interleukin-1 receptor domain-containing protein [Mycolicibacterium fortuitum]OMC42595.1 hypothetical protein A5742_30350 [Mycolicibacterium fortuitum]
MAFSPTGFWSYAHADDENSGGQVLRLARHLAAEFRLLTGTDLTLFVDRESLEWGDEWRKKVDTSIHGTTFFIPIVTPTYFQRDECRRELLLFHRKSSASDLQELLLPIIFAPINFDEESDDEVLAIVSKRQGEPFWDIRLEDETSSVYRKAIHKLAARLKAVSESVEERAELTDIPASAMTEATTDQLELDDEPGFLDLIAEMLDDLLPAWAAAIESLTVDLKAIETTLDEHQPNLTRANSARTMGPRIVALRNAAVALEAPTTNFLEHAKRYKTLTAEIGKGIAASAEMALMSGDQEDIQKGIDTAESIVEVQATLDEAMRAADPLLGVMRDMGRASRDMRPPTKRITEAITVISDSRTLYGQWVDTLTSLRSALEDDGSPSQTT